MSLVAVQAFEPAFGDVMSERRFVNAQPPRARVWRSSTPCAAWIPLSDLPVAVPAVRCGGKHSFLFPRPLREPLTRPLPGVPRRGVKSRWSRLVGRLAVPFLLLVTLALTGPSARANPTVIVAVGAEGSAEYSKPFSDWADRWAQAATKGSAKLVQIGRDAEGNAAGATDRDRLKQTIGEEAKASVSPADPLWLVLIGHGTFDGKEAKLNLRGPDVSDAELADWLKLVSRPLAIVDCTSASAPFLKKLSGPPNRVVITATRTGSENNYARFGDYLSAAIADPSADIDRDGQTSLLEAFIAASRRTDEFYKGANRLATEHALLDDNGDALGTPADWFQGTRVAKASKDGKPADGSRAHRWHLVLSAEEQAMPAEARATRDKLEAQIETLRAKKPQMPATEYYAQLEKLLLQLAAVYEKP